MTITTPEHASVIEDMDGASHTIFRWEAASGLEHTCYACTTKMNNPKAKQTCYGIHSIPCFRYHQTMHAIGTSHNCFACIQADTMHENRHRHIAELVAEFKATEEDESTFSGKNKKDFQFSLPLRELDPNMPPPPAEASANDRRRRAAPAPLFIPDDQTHSNDHESEEENKAGSPSSNSATTPSTTSSTTTPRLTKADARAAKRAARSAKSQRKSLKNQTKLAYTVSVKATDVEHIAITLHGSSFTADPSSNDASAADAKEGARHPLASDKTIEDVIERNRRYCSSIQAHKAYLLREVGGQRKKERRERVKKQQAKQKDYRMGRARNFVQEDADDADGRKEEEDGLVVDAILTKLGITSTSSSSSSTTIADGYLTTTPNKRHSTSSASGSLSSHGHSKHALIAQLRVAIAEDLQKHENEQRHTLIRAGGFWRYVGRQVFERMCEIGERIDWRTGMIKKGQDESANGGHAEEAADKAAATGGDGDDQDDQEAREPPDTAVQEQKQKQKQDHCEQLARRTDSTGTSAATEADNNNNWNVVGNLKRDRRHLRRAGRVVNYPTINQKARDALLDEASYQDQEDALEEDAA